MYFASLLVSLLSFTNLAVAAPSSEALMKAFATQTSCQTFVRFNDQHLFLGVGGVKMISLSNPEDTHILKTKDVALDLIPTADGIFILTPSGLEEWNPSTLERVAVHATSTTPPTALAKKQYPHGMARFENQLIIAHGRGGLSFFDLTSRRLLRQVSLVDGQRPLESMATDVIVQGERAYVLMDNYSLVRLGKQPFRGIVVVDLRRGAVVAELDGMDPGADALVSDGKSLIVSFMGVPIWKYNLKSLKTQMLPEPVNRIWQFNVPGHPTGKPAMDDKYYYTCFSKSAEGPGGSVRRLPMVLDRRVLMLD